MSVDPGKEARDGFWFQDAVILLRLLTDGLDRRAARALGKPEPPAVRVAIEKAAVETAPDLRTTWDCVTYTADTVFVEGSVVLDEMKKGDISKADRVAFWKRLRTTASGLDARSITPRLTLGSGAVDNPEKWRGLANGSRTARAKQLERVATSDALASEALWFLTSKSRSLKEWPPPISAEVARALLSRFVFDDSYTSDALFEKLRATIVTIGSETDPDLSVDQLAGWIARLARSPEAEAVAFEDVVERVQLLHRYLALRPEAEHLWNRVRAARLPPPAQSMPLQPWRSVQPTAASQLEKPIGAVVVTASGGSGKSFFLDGFLEQHRTSGTGVWIDASEQHDVVLLGEAIRFGAWATSRRCEPLVIVVDGLDGGSAAPLLTTLRSVLTAFSSPHPPRVVGAMRSTTWEDARDSLPNWLEIPLERWNEDTIREVLGHQRVPLPAADVLELLRSPLLLDVFVRTFSGAVNLPAGLSTRHKLLDEYFKRVLAGSHAPGRRAVLERGVAAAARGEQSWADAASEAVGLVAQGVLVNDRGRLHFRHSLLRDYCAAMAAPRSPIDVAATLGAIASSVTRADFLRAIVEAELEGDLSRIEQVLEACQQQQLVPAVALSLVDEPTRSLVDVVARIADGAVLNQTLERAGHRGTRNWLRLIADYGGSRPSWLGPRMISALSLLVSRENLRQKGDSENRADDDTTSLARTVRGWTHGLSHAEAGLLLDWTWELLARVLADNDSLRWFTSLDLTDREDRYGVRMYARTLRQLVTRNTGVNANLLAAALRKAAYAMGDPVDLLGSRGHLEDLAHECLTGGNRGLLATRPDVAVPLVFELSVLQQEATERQIRSYESDPELEEMLQETFHGSNEKRRERIARIEPLARPPLRSQQVAMGGLVDDEPHHSDHDTMSQLFTATRSVAAGSASLAMTVVDAALASRSVRARLDALCIDPQADWSPANVSGLRAAQERLLCDERIYFASTQRRLWDRIRSLWPIASPQTRDAVRANVLAIAGTEFPGAERVGTLASAIPEVERTSDFTEYLKLAEYLGQTEPSELESSVVEYERAPAEEIPEGTPEVAAALMRDIINYTVTPDDGSMRLSAFDALREAVADGWLEPGSPWRVWLAVSIIVDRDQRREVRTLQPSTLRALMDLALRGAEAARSVAGPDVTEWRNFIDIADACAAHPTYQDDAAMRRSIFDEVEVAAGNHGERLAYAVAAVRHVRPWHWYQDAQAQALVVHWFREVFRDEGLSSSLQAIDPSRRVSELLELLSRNDRLDPDNAAVQPFLHDAGIFLAQYIEYESDGGALRRLREWCEAADRPGVLAGVKAWEQLTSAMMWWFERAIAEDWLAAHRKFGLRNRFLELAPLVWRAWPRGPGRSANGSISHSLFRPLHRDSRKSGDAAWGTPLAALLIEVVRDGDDDDVSAAIYDLDIDAFTTNELSALAEVSGSRLERVVREPTRTTAPHGIGELVADLCASARTPLAAAKMALDALNRASDTFLYLGKEASRAEDALRTRERSTRPRG